MSNKNEGYPKLFWITFLILTFTTILTLIFSVRFYAQPTVQTQVSGFVEEGLNGRFDEADHLTRATQQPTLPSPMISVEPSTSTIKPSSPPSSQPQANFAPTFTLRIPTLAVNETIVNVPIQDGQWDISQLSTQVGRLESTGRYPGDDYAMAFVGHIAEPVSGSGPFSHLVEIRHGETIILEDETASYRYRVERINWVSPNDVRAIYQQDGEMILLVTCSSWDVLSQDYTQRLIVQAKLEVMPQKMMGK